MEEEEEGEVEEEEEEKEEAGSKWSSTNESHDCLTSRRVWRRVKQSERTTSSGAER